MITRKLLERRSGVKQPQISNFLLRKRRVSIVVLDRILAALELGVEELAPAPATPGVAAVGVPLVSDEAAMEEERIPAAAVREQVLLPEPLAARIFERPGLRGRRDDRFLALAVTAEQALPMHPVLREGSLVVLDRHAAVPVPRPGRRPAIYAVRQGGRIAYGYTLYQHGLLLVRPHAPELPLATLAVTPPSTPAEFLVGRVVAVLAHC